MERGRKRNGKAPESSLLAWLGSIALLTVHEFRFANSLTTSRKATVSTDLPPIECMWADFEIGLKTNVDLTGCLKAPEVHLQKNRAPKKWCPVVVFD